MKLQADPKNSQSYKRLLEHCNINLKSIEGIKKYYASSMNKIHNMLLIFQISIVNLMMTEEQIKVLSVIEYKSASAKVDKQKIASLL